MQRVSIDPRAGRAWDLLSNARYKLAAVAVWGVACITTNQFLAPLIDDVVTRWAVTIALQLVLTVVESEFWQGQRGQVSGAAVAIDTLINAAGLYPFVGSLGATNVWTMISEATGAAADVGTIAAVVISLFLGYILAATPERVWR